jgi:succinyl-diaminopimelate desuccinylase
MSRDPLPEILAILTDLVAIPSVYPPGDSSRIAAYLHDSLASAGYAVETHAVVPGMDNVVARMGSGRPSLVFNAHVDTVDPGDLSQWSRAPFELTVSDGRAFGLGAANCKGSAAVQLWLAKELARRGGPRRGEVVFTFVTDEESLGPNGMCALREKGVVKPDMLLLGAPTENTLITAERGVLWVEIKTTGQAAHAGEPERGDNAILRMARVLQHVQDEMGRRLRERTDGEMRSTMNIGRIAGGQNTNVVPSRCTVEIDRRLLPSESVTDAFQELREIVFASGEPAGTVSIRRLCGTNGFVGRDDGAMVMALRRAIQEVTGAPAGTSTAIGVSDGRYFAEDGIEIVNFGPGEGTEGHASNESVSLASLRTSAQVLQRVTSELLGGGIEATTTCRG